MTFTDGGRLHDGETARALAELGTYSGINRLVRRTSVTFVIADWTLAQLSRLPGAQVEVAH